MSADKQTSRLQKSLKQWIKCSVWSIIYILFIVWVGNYWWLLGLPVVFDLFITNYIPWTWWKNTKNKSLLGLMGWVDAIVFALVAVYFINTFLFQNYQIPSSSLDLILDNGEYDATSLPRRNRASRVTAWVDGAMGCFQEEVSR